MAFIEENMPEALQLLSPVVVVSSKGEKNTA